MVLQRISVALTKTDTRPLAPIVVYTSIRDLYVLTDISAESGPSAEPCKDPFHNLSVLLSGVFR